MVFFGDMKRIVKLLLPPILTSLLEDKLRGMSHRQATLEYAPGGWKSPQGSRMTGWNAESIVQSKKAQWDEFFQLVRGTGPLVFSPESADVSDTQKLSVHDVYMTYAYVLALAAHHKTRVSVLDYGGGLGHFYQIGKMLLPAVTLEFHCRELPLMAETGKMLNPEVCWYTDESFLKRSYDLVMVNASLQYIHHWQDTLGRIGAAVNEEGYLLLTRLPVVQGPSFAAIQRMYGSEMMHWQLNQDAVLEVVESTGLRLVREMFIGDRPYIKGAPMRCELKGWLFKRESAEEKKTAP
jgi:putative methyltransferase (TIGR04325 family)